MSLITNRKICEITPAELGPLNRELVETAAAHEFHLDCVVDLETGAIQR